jgi:hypothetical protein
MKAKLLYWLEYDFDAWIDRWDCKLKKAIYYFLAFSAGYFLRSII